MEMRFGVVLIAVDSPFYGQLAYNLALSIKLDRQATTITLVSGGRALDLLSERQRSVFDRIEQLDLAPYRQGGRVNPYRIKVDLFDLSPYEHTLYLDVDSIFFNDYRSLHELVDDLADCDLQIQEEHRYRKDDAGRNLQYQWADLVSIWQSHRLADSATFIDYNSSFLWFRKTRAVEEYFALVRRLYDDPGVEVQRLGEFVPDEVAFSLASAKSGFFGPREGFRPIYLQNYSERNPRHANRATFAELTRDEEAQAIVRDHYFLGLPAIPPTVSIVAFYNHLVACNARTVGEEPFFFRVEEKLVSQLRPELLGGWRGDSPKRAD